MAQLVNKYNDGNLVVTVNFVIGSDEYEITRGLKPTLFELKKNGTAIDSLSSKKLNQDEIDKLLGINERLFKNIVGVAVTNNKPFLSMSVGDKRSLIESIFNIDVLSEMGKEVKKRNTVDRSEQRLKLTEASNYEDRINDNKSTVENIKQHIEKFEENRKNQIDHLQNEIEKFDKKIKKNIANIKLGEDKIAEMQGKFTCPSDEEFAKLASNIGVAEHEKASILKTLKMIGNSSTCPICGSELDEGHAKEHLDKLKADLKVLEDDTIPHLKELETQYNAQKEAVKNNQNLIDEISDRLKEEIFNKSNYEKNITQLKKQITEVKNQVCELSLDEYTVKISMLEEQLKQANEQVAVLNHNIEKDTKLIEILGDDGLRMFFFKQLLPILNSKINHYLKKFELPVTLEFDQYMVETIKTGKFEQQYNQFSGGERCRIDMAILLSFFDISKIISNWSCSILMIDEILDAGVDQDGISQFISTLYNIVTEENKDLGIYVISHKLSDLQVAWENIIEIEKKSLFSELKVK
jgi:DNA repair exonuclease SbcCD ATPase subunit